MVLSKCASLFNWVPGSIEMSSDDPRYDLPFEAWAYYSLRRNSVRNADDLIDIIEKCKERITLLSRQVFEAFPDKVAELH